VNEFQIQGLDGVLEKMRKLGPDLAKKGARTAMRKAANVVRDAAKEGWRRVDRPETPNNIANNVAIAFSSKAFRANGDVMMRVGIRGGARQPYANTRANRRSGRVGQTHATEGSTYYWRFLEFGFFSVKAGRDIPPQHVMRDALSQNVEQATTVAVVELNKAIDRYCAKENV
jgi:HK97 gp10 family phage protein